MADHQIACVRYEDGVIEHVGVGGTLYSIPEIVESMKKGHTFHTYRDNTYAEVVRRWSSKSNRYYLTTEPDNTYQNNLEFLPSC